MFTTAFLRAALERAVKTFAQSLAALLVADGTDLLTTNWGDRLSVAGMAAVVSVLTSVASSATGEGPSLGNAETLNPAAPDKAVAIPVEPAADFYEDDEPVEKIKAIAAQGPHGTTGSGTFTSAQTISREFDGMGAPISQPRPE